MLTSGLNWASLPPLMWLMEQGGLMEIKHQEAWGGRQGESRSRRGL